MSYLEQGFIEFFSELSYNNSSEWFNANRKRYENFVKEPFKKLVKDLIPYVQNIDPLFVAEPKDLIFRINRDIRFSKDKSPYKLNVAAAFGIGGKKSIYPDYYLHIESDKIWIGGGCYQPDKDSLYKIRQEIVYSADKFSKAIDNKEFKDYYGELKGEKAKTTIADWKEAASLQPYVFNKQFYFMKELPQNHITSENLLETIDEGFRAGSGVYNFLKEALM